MFVRGAKDGIFVTSILAMYGVGAQFRDFGAHTLCHNCHRCTCENEELIGKKNEEHDEHENRSSGTSMCRILAVISNGVQ